MNTLQQRAKWKQESSNIKLGTMVLLKTDNSPSMHGLLGRVKELYLGQDSKIRDVSVSPK